LASGRCRTPLTEENAGTLQGRLMTVVQVDDAAAATVTGTLGAGDSARATVRSINSMSIESGRTMMRDVAVDHRAIGKILFPSVAAPFAAYLVSESIRNPSVNSMPVGQRRATRISLIRSGP
jgi:hypothetical protein